MKAVAFSKIEVGQKFEVANQYGYFDLMLKETKTKAIHLTRSGEEKTGFGYYPKYFHKTKTVYPLLEKE